MSQSPEYDLQEPPSPREEKGLSEGRERERHTPLPGLDHSFPLPHVKLHGTHSEANTGSSLNLVLNTINRVRVRSGQVGWGQTLTNVGVTHQGSSSHLHASCTVGGSYTRGHQQCPHRSAGTHRFHGYRSLRGK